MRHYTEHLPSPPLRRVVACYWHFWVVPSASGPLTHFVPPDGGMNLALVPVGERVEVHLLGPRTEPQCETVPPGLDCWGVRFQPGAGGESLGLDSTKLVNEVVPLSSVRPELSHDLSQVYQRGAPRGNVVARLDALFGPIASRTDLDPIVMKAVRAILNVRGSIQVTPLVRESGLSQRQFERRFRRAVGLTCKELARVRRIRAAAIEVLERDDAFAEVALSGGFSDQAHLVREFRRLIGQSPRSFRGTIRGIEHGDYEA